MGSSSKQETKIPEMSDEEKSFMAKASAMADQWMAEQGYDTKKNEVTTYDNPARIEALEQKKLAIQQSIDARKATTNQKGIIGPEDEKELARLQQDLSRISSKLEKEYSTAHKEFSYDIELNETGKQIQEMRQNSLRNQAAIDQMTVDVATKYFNGDYSINASQQDLIKNSLSTVRDATFAMLDQVKSEAEATGRSLTSVLNESLTQFTDTINQTNLSTGAALNAVRDQIELNKAGIKTGLAGELTAVKDAGLSVSKALDNIMAQVNQTGADTLDALEKAFATRSVLAQHEMEDYYQTTRNETAVRATSLGRSPMDPQFQQELQDKMTRKIGDLQLSMFQDEMLAKSGVLERTGMRKEEILKMAAQNEADTAAGIIGVRQKETSLEAGTGEQLTTVAGQQAQLASDTGSKREALAGQALQGRMGIAERTGGLREGIAGQKAATEQNLQTTGQNLALSWGQGIPATQVGLGIDLAGYNQALRQQMAANTQTGVGINLPQQELALRERMAQPTTTTTSSTSPWAYAIGGLGSLASGAGSVMGGIGAMRA